MSRSDTSTHSTASSLLAATGDSASESLVASLLIDPLRLRTLLGAAMHRVDVDAVAVCQSTNSTLLQKNSANATALASGSVLVADRQTAGRGRRGRQWLSAQTAPQDSLTFSLFWRFPRQTVLSGLSLAVGLALRRALAELACDDVRLKWPNDLLIRQGKGWAKLGGILIELTSNASGTAAVIGIGLNLRTPQSPELTQIAAGLDSLQKTELPERHALLAALLRHLVVMLDEFSQSGFAAQRSEWERFNAFAGAPVTLYEEGLPSQDGICLGADDDGALRVQTATGIRRWLAGDVSLRPQLAAGS